MKDKFAAFIADFRKNRTRNIILLLVFAALVIYAYIISFSMVIPASKVLNADTDTFFSTNIQDISMVSGSEVTQTFTARGDVLGFQLDFSAEDASVQGTVQVSLTDMKTGTEVYRHDMKISDLGADSLESFFLDTPIYEAKGNQYKITITTAGQLAKSDVLVIKSSSVNTYNNGSLSVNGQKNGGDLHFKVFDSDNLFLVPVYWGVVAFVLVAFLILTYLLLLNKLKPQHMFVVCVLSIGTLYIFLMTPLSIPDEPAHYDTTYRYSNLVLMKGDPTPEEGAPKGDYILNRPSDVEFLKQFTISPMLKEYKYINRHLLDKVEDNVLVSSKAQLVKTTPYVYFPATFGITVARLLNLSSGAVFYAGRICNLLFFAFAGFFAIRKIPFGKMILFVAGMLPMTMQQVSSYSYDAVVYGLAFLFISYCLHAAFDDTELRRTDIFILCILGALLAPAKAVYVCLCLLVFLIPNERFKPLKMYSVKHRKAKCITAILGSAALSFLFFNLLNIMTNYVKIDTNVLSYGTVPGYTASFLLSHPGKLFMIIRLTLLNNSSYYLESMLGKFLGWLVLDVPSIYMYGFFGLLILSTIKIDQEKVFLTHKHKILILGILGSVFALVCAAMLLSFTPMTENSVLGVQGRYFLPVLPLALLFFRNDRIVLKRSMTQLMIFSVWVLQILTVADIFQWVLLQALK
ncbi:MAG: DUF2142 domain-containing protein [Eubacteriales bacterium]